MLCRRGVQNYASDQKGFGIGKKKTEEGEQNQGGGPWGAGKQQHAVPKVQKMVGKCRKWRVKGSTRSHRGGGKTAEHQKPHKPSKQSKVRH